MKQMPLHYSARLAGYGVSLVIIKMAPKSHEASPHFVSSQNSSLPSLLFFGDSKILYMFIRSELE
jgi:hypothetical protein